MRPYALLLGVFLLPVSLRAQQSSVSPQIIRSGQLGLAAPVRGLPSAPCIGNAVSLNCRYNQRYPNQWYGYQRSQYDRRVRSEEYEWWTFDPSRRVYGAGSYRRAYGDARIPSCPTAQGGVAVVSPANPRVIATRSGARIYRSQPYALVVGVPQIGCSR